MTMYIFGGHIYSGEIIAQYKLLYKLHKEIGNLNAMQLTHRSNSTCNDVASYTVCNEKLQITYLLTTYIIMWYN